MREEIFYHFFLFVCNFGPQEVSSLPFPGPLFLTRHSVCCTFNQHTGLFLRCTIKELFLCLTPLFSLLWFGGDLLFACEAKRQSGRHCGLGWAGMVGKTSWTASSKSKFIHCVDCHWVSPLPGGSCRPRWVWREGGLVCWEAALLRTVCGVWQTRTQIPAPSLLNGMDLSKSLHFFKP